jgi:hypothetical protein
MMTFTKCEMLNNLNLKVGGSSGRIVRKVRKVYVFRILSYGLHIIWFCKDFVKEPPLTPPPPTHFKYSPSPVNYTFALVSGHRCPFSPIPFRSKFHKEVAVFWRQMLVNSICKGTSLLIQRGLITLSFSETCFLKTTCSIALIFLALFPQTKVR